MRNSIAVVLTIVVLVAGAFLGYTWSTEVIHGKTSTTTVYTSSANSGNAAIVMSVNGSLYRAEDVSNDIAVQDQAYAHFLNGSVTFSGVKFETICPSYYSGCPGGSPNQVKTEVGLAAIEFNMTFPDGIVEAAGMVIGVVGESSYMFVLSHHTGPRGGILYEYVGSYKVFLLVSE